MKATDFRRTVALPEARRRAILENVGSMSSSAGDDVSSGDGGGHLRDIDVGVAITQTGGRTALFAVPARPTGQNTLCFLHSGFLHSGTKCEIFALREAGPVSLASGEVRWVQHVDGGVHAVGVRFDAPIDPQALVAESASKRPGRGASLSDIRGRVLILDDQKVDTELARMHLKTVGLEVVVSSDTTTALAALEPEPPDVLVCDLNLGNGMSGEAAMKVLARRGFTGPVVVMTAEDDRERLRAVREAGAFAIVHKPYDRKTLLVAVTAALVKSGAIKVRPVPPPQVEPTPLNSTLAWSTETEELVTMYIEQTRGLAEGLRSAMEASDRDSIRRACMTLKGTGSGYGFELLTMASSRALDAMGPAATPAAMSNALEEILALATRLAPPAKAA